MNHAGFTIWLTGLSGAGKSTISEMLSKELNGRNIRCEVLDGDLVREHLSKGLSFSREDRDTNVFRIGFVAALLSRNGIGVIVSAISPYNKTRDKLRGTIKNFIEVFVNCPIDECERRDVKGLYKMARAGAIKSFTGIDDPYEEPSQPEVICYTAEETLECSVAKILKYLEAAKYIPSESTNDLWLKIEDNN
jgi:adenylylsulfate kinase